jgi:hypothetical protein
VYDGIEWGLERRWRTRREHDMTASNAITAQQLSRVSRNHYLELSISSWTLDGRSVQVCSGISESLVTSAIAVYRLL